MARWRLWIARIRSSTLLLALLALLFLSIVSPSLATPTWGLGDSCDACHEAGSGSLDVHPLFHAVVTDCASCHSGTPGPGNVPPSACAACHAPADAPPPTIIVGNHPQVIAQSYCWGCHGQSLRFALNPGWSLVAGGSNSYVLGQPAFYFEGSAYYSTTAVNFEPGRGYWIRTSGGTAWLKTVQPPLSIRLAAGWNLVGNSSPVPVVLPEGTTAFVFDGARYLSRGTLEPGEGAWIRAETMRQIELTERPPTPSDLAKLFAWPERSVLAAGADESRVVVYAEDKYRRPLPGLDVDVSYAYPERGTAKIPNPELSDGPVATTTGTDGRATLIWQEPVHSWGVQTVSVRRPDLGVFSPPATLQWAIFDMWEQYVGATPDTGEVFISGLNRIWGGRWSTVFLDPYMPPIGNGFFEAGTDLIIDTTHTFSTRPYGDRFYVHFEGNDTDGVPNWLVGTGRPWVGP